ncbi:MAG: flagellar basal body L-ring protein FlgH [Myxococcota bacterium]
MSTRWWWGWMFAVVMGCGPAHIAPYTPKERAYPPPPPPPSGETASEGSLLKPGSTGSLYTDARAFRENDIVIVKVVEEADAQRRADTELGKRSSVSSVLNALPFLDRFINPNPALDLPRESRMDGQHDMSFEGKGATGRSERFVATVPVVVRRVLPNGNLFVEGHRVILVNNEEHHFYVSGVIRPIDIEQDNTIRSSQVADAEIEFVGRGRMSDAQEQGWFSRFISWLSPF